MRIDLSHTPLPTIGREAFYQLNTYYLKHSDYSNTLD
jgi:hypothetical protein